MTFEMWSIGHYVFMISPFVITFLIVLLSKHKSHQFKQHMGIVLSVIAVIFLILRNVEIMVKNSDVFDYEIIPLQICHFANFVLLYAFITNSKASFGLATLFNLPAAMMSIVFANSLENYQTILSLRGIAYILGHVLIVVITLYAFFTGFVQLNKKVFRQTISIVIGLYLMGLIINNVLLLTTGTASNYFYATRPESGTPLAIFFEWGKEYNLGGFFIVNPIYLFLTASLGIIIISVLYMLLKWIAPKDKKPEMIEKETAGFRSLVKESSLK